MAIRAFVGQAQALDGRDAAVQATNRALEQAGRNKVALAMVMASHSYSIQQVAEGVSSVLSDPPLFGFSTVGEISGDGLSQRSVIVALLCGDMRARAEWWPGFAEDSRAVGQLMAQELRLDKFDGVLLLSADGVNGDARQLCANLPPGKYCLFGCLAGGDVRFDYTYQLGGRKSGVNGLAAAVLTGEQFVFSVGSGHGWVSLQNYMSVTQAADSQVKALDHRSPADIYAQWMGFTSDEWCKPPLSHLVRLYPLGVEETDKVEPIIRSPLYLETNGSLYMHSAISEESKVSLMVGSNQACIQAAENATRRALEKLGPLKPVLAIVLVDIAWQMLMEAQPGAEIDCVRRILGDDVPLVGGYTFGQFASMVSSPPDLLNQHLAILLLAEAGEK